MDLATIKQLAEENAKLTEQLAAKVAESKAADVLQAAEIGKMQAALADGLRERKEAEIKLLDAIADAKALAEEAAIKAGRKGAANDDPAAAIALEHKQAFEALLRSPNDWDLQRALKAAEAKALEAKAISTTTGETGGFAVPSMISARLQEKASHRAVMRNLVEVELSGVANWSRNVDKGGMGYGWVGEGDARNTTDTPGLYEALPTFGTIYAYPEASDESLDDILFNVEDWLTKSAQKAFATGEDIAIISGNGTKKPTGFLASAPVATGDATRADGVLQYIPSGAAAAFGADVFANISAVRNALKAAYRPNGVWVMNSNTAATIAGVKDTTGRPLWQESMIAGVPSQLMGHRVEIAEHMPDIAADAFPIAFGDWEEGYVLVDRHSLRVTRDEVTKPGFVRWHIRRRVGGCVTNDWALKLLKIAAA